MLHSWEILGHILASEEATDILCDVGMYDAKSLSPLRLLMKRQANRAQKCHLQLSSYLFQRQDSAHPAENVACE
jgi:hypothetical protein